MRRSRVNERRIILIARVILIAVATVTGSTVFFVMKSHAEQELSTSLRSALKNDTLLASTEIERSFKNTEVVATRPFLIDQLRIVAVHPEDEPALTALRRGARSFLTSGFSAIALFDKSGRKLVQAGQFVHEPEQQVPVRLNGHSKLLYKSGYFLRTRLEILRAGVSVGHILTDTPLPILNGMFATTRQWGATAELAMCASSNENTIRCFPSSRPGHALERSNHSAKGRALPIVYALRGEAGSVVAHDHRGHEVVAAFRPVSHLGLGMVLKIDSAELYAPVWGQLRYLLPLLAGLLVLALLSLRWLFTPLVSELVRSEQETYETNERLRNSEKRVRMLVNSVAEGIVSISADGRIELFNPGAERMFGYRSEDVMGRNVSLLMDEPHRSQHDEYLARYLETGVAHIIGNPREVVARRRDGSNFPMELRVSQLDSEGRRKFIGIMYDISERKAIEEKIAHFANYDALTDLPNRRLTQDRIQQSVMRSKRMHTQFALMFVDLDEFKSVNDTLGHDAGDQLLKLVADRLAACLRAEDTVGRQGGDEFIVLLSNMIDAQADASLVAEKILAELSRPFELSGRPLNVRASIGIAIYPRDGADAEALLKSSDTAMYYAKKTKGGNYRFLAESLDTSEAD